VTLTAIDLATNPRDTLPSPTVTIAHAVTLTDNAPFGMQGVATGSGTSAGAGLTFASTVSGPGTLTISSTTSPTVTFGSAVSSAVVLQGGQLNSTATLTLAGTGSLSIGAGLTETTGALASSSSNTAVQLGSGSNLITGGNASTTFAGSIGGPGTLTKTGSSDFTLSGTNSYAGPTVIAKGILTVNGTLQTATNSVNLDDASSALNGTGRVLRPVIATSTGSGSRVGGSAGANLTVTNVGGSGIDVQAGANNVTISGVTATGNNVGILVEPGSGNTTTITVSTITSNMQGLEVLNGCITATGNVITGNNVSVYLPAVNPNNASLPVNPLLTLEGNNISGNTTGLQNSSTMAVTAILNWWGNSAGPGAVDSLSRNPVAGVNVNDFTPYALDATSAGLKPTTFNFFNGTGADGNVYVTGTLGADSILAMVDGVNSNIIHVTGPHSGAYTRGGAGNRLIVYSFGADMPGTHDTITVSGSWNAEIHAAALAYREPPSFGGTSSATITTLGSGNDVIFGGGNDNINADSSGNNVIVAGLSTGKTGAPTGPRISGGSGSNLYIAGSVDCALAPLAPSGRLDYATLRAMDDLWALGMGGMADAMSTAALFSVANTAGAIQTGTARATITSGSGKSWYLVKGAGNPVYSPTGINADYVTGSTGNPNYRQAIQ